MLVSKRLSAVGRARNVICTTGECRASEAIPREGRQKMKTNSLIEERAHCPSRRGAGAETKTVSLLTTYFKNIQKTFSYYIFIFVSKQKAEAGNEEVSWTSAGILG